METLAKIPTTKTLETPSFQLATFVSTDTVIADTETEPYFFHDNLILRALEAEQGTVQPLTFG